MSNEVNTDEIRARLEAATPGPWAAHTCGCVLSQTDTVVFDTSNAVDATFIAHAPTDIENLLAENDRLKAVMRAASGDPA